MLTERPRLVLTVLSLLATAGPGPAAEHRTRNFVVEAPSDEVARQVGASAERHRRALARAWLGKEMPDWSEPCPLQVSVTLGGSGGATTFHFDRGRVLSQHMRVEGTLDRLLVSVLPHEVAHTVFAHDFGRPVPRWADEGGAVLGEDPRERARHEKAMRQMLGEEGRRIPLRRLLALQDYPPDMLALYVQGYSLTRFLVALRDRPTFLAFLKDGADGDWDRALNAHYGYKKVEELERAWLAGLKRPGPVGGGTPTPPRGPMGLRGRRASPVLCALRERPPVPTGR